MSRVPSLPRAQLPTEEAKELYDSLNRTAASFAPNVKATTKEGGLLGPLPFYLRQPQAGAALIALMNHIGRVPGLSLEARETALLAAGSNWKARFQLHAHSKIAIEASKLSTEQVESIAKGEKPHDLDDPCSAAFDVALYLSSKPGPLPQRLWDTSVKALGNDGTDALIHHVGFYAYMCTILNAVDSPLLEEIE